MTSNLIRKYIDIIAEAKPYQGSTGSQQIKALNPQIKDINQIKIGQKINIPGQSEPYVVKKGDTLDKIAQQMNVVSKDDKSSSVIGPERRQGSYRGYPYTVGSLDDLKRGQADQSADAPAPVVSEPKSDTVVPEPVVPDTKPATVVKQATREPNELDQQRAKEMGIDLADPDIFLDNDGVYSRTHGALWKHSGGTYDRHLAAKRQEKDLPAGYTNDWSKITNPQGEVTHNWSNEQGRWIPVAQRLKPNPEAEAELQAAPADDMELMLKDLQPPRPERTLDMEDEVEPVTVDAPGYQANPKEEPGQLKENKNFLGTYMRSTELMRNYLDLVNERVMIDPETGERTPSMAQQLTGPEATDDQMDQAEERQRAALGLPSLASQREADYQRRLAAHRRGDNRAAGFGFQPRPGD